MVSAPSISWFWGPRKAVAMRGKRASEKAPGMIFLRGKQLQALYKPCYLDAQASAIRPTSH